MAITARSFSLSPRLLGTLIASIAAVVFIAALVLGTRPTIRCAATLPADRQNWTQRQWADNTSCLIEQRAYDSAYSSAEAGIAYFPRSETLYNLRGYAAAELQQYGLATFDFAEGIRKTPSRTGLLENNLAWSMLWQVDELSTERRRRALLQARRLYETSLRKSTSCERIHTGMFVEYAIADDLHRHRLPGLHHALQRYAELHAQYEGCESRLAHHDRDIVREFVGASVIDREMSKMAGVALPVRQVKDLHRALDLAHELDMNTATLCDRSVPIHAARPACETQVYSR